MIATADRDPLHYEGEAYAEDLKVVDAGKALIDQMGTVLHKALA